MVSQRNSHRPASERHSRRFWNYSRTRGDACYDIRYDGVKLLAPQSQHPVEREPNNGGGETYSKSVEWAAQHIRRDVSKRVRKRRSEGRQAAPTHPSKFQTIGTVIVGFLYLCNPCA